MARSAVLLSVFVLFVAAATPHARGQDGGFTSNERDALGRGELVTRPRRETRAERLWVGGTSYQQIERPRAEVWRGVRDVGHWREMLPETAETRAERGVGEQQLVGIRHSYGPIDARYTLRVDFGAPVSGNAANLGTWFSFAFGQVF